VTPAGAKRKLRIDQFNPEFSWCFLQLPMLPAVVLQ